RTVYSPANSSNAGRSAEVPIRKQLKSVTRMRKNVSLFDCLCRADICFNPGGNLFRRQLTQGRKFSAKLAQKRDHSGFTDRDEGIHQGACDDKWVKMDHILGN